MSDNLSQAQAHEVAADLLRLSGLPRCTVHVGFDNSVSIQPGEGVTVDDLGAFFSARVTTGKESVSFDGSRYTPRWFDVDFEGARVHVWEHVYAEEGVA